MICTMPISISAKIRIAPKAKIERIFQRRQDAVGSRKKTAQAITRSIISHPLYPSLRRIAVKVHLLQMIRITLRWR
jgi:hypothetical protein